ncbi:hypothetical protein INR49_032095 [Caranx melampygus]|nr:hypothetical protein INR49_032095 [Caranx melampygus]
MYIKSTVNTGRGMNWLPWEEQSLRLRRASSRVSNQNYPQFHWNSPPEEEDDEVDSGPTRDLRSIPMHMGLKRAVRFLVVLNFVSFLLIAGFVLTPSIVFRSKGTSIINSTGSPEECMDYDPNPQNLQAFYNYFLDLLSGTGFMEYSYLFYGYYNNTLVEDTNFSYNIPLAYLFTAVFYFAFCLICIIERMGTAARVAVATGGSAVGNYSKIVFTGWDYGCLGDQATKLKQKNIHYRLQKMSGKQGILGLLIEYLPSIVITAGNFLVPSLCDQIALIERYSPSTTIIMALLRAVFLRLVSLGVILFTLWRQITCEGDTNSGDCQLCQYNHGVYQCWETRVGQEMYKLTLFDLLINIAVLVLVEFPRRMVVDNWQNKLTQWFGRQEFVVPSNVLGLVYGQTVVWAGALFCPLLPLMNTIKFIILFYTKKEGCDKKFLVKQIEELSKQLKIPSAGIQD